MLIEAPERSWWPRPDRRMSIYSRWSECGLSSVDRGGRASVPFISAAVPPSRKAGAYTPPLFGSTQAHFMGYVGCMKFPQSIRQGDTGRCDQNG
jgi:hypothetical protein